MPVLGFALIAGAVGIQAAEYDQWSALYDQAPTILIREPRGVIKGSLPEDRNIIQIRLTDVAKYTGHVCAGIASGYMMTHLALQVLYPESIPERGQIRIAGSALKEPVCVAAYITGADPHGHEGNDMVIDPSLSTGKPGDVVMVFQRKDTGKSVKTIFHKFNLVPPDTARKIKNLVYHKIPEGRASYAEKEYVRKTVQSYVKKVILDTPEDVIEIVIFVPFDEGEYEFPKAEREK